MASGQESKLPTISDKDISDKVPLSKGSFGHLFVCKWQNVKCVMKVLNETGGLHNWALKKLQKEILLLKNLSKQSQLFVEVHALYINKGIFCGYLMEYCELGSMRDFLSRFSHADLETSRFPWLVFSLLRDVCGAMEILQERQVKPIFHKDLALDNILITSEMRAKLSDFGLSKELNSLVSPETLSVERSIGVERRPPELIQDPLRQPDEFIDRFLFGICLLEALVCASIRQRVGGGVEEYKRLAVNGLLSSTLRAMADRECFLLYPSSLQSPQACFDALRSTLLATLEAAVSQTPSDRPAFSAISADWSARLPPDFHYSLERERNLVLGELTRDRAVHQVIPGIQVCQNNLGPRRLDSGVDTSAVPGQPKTPIISIGRVLGNIYVHQLRPGELAEPSPHLHLRFPDKVPLSDQLLRELVACPDVQSEWNRLGEALDVPSVFMDGIVVDGVQNDEATRRILEAAAHSRVLTLKRLGDAFKSLNCHGGLRLMQPYASG